MARPKGSPKLGGRKKGTPNKLTANIKEMVREALSEVGGVSYLVTQARENPTAFLTLVGKLMPTTLDGDSSNPIRMVTTIQLVAGRDYSEN